MRSNQPSIAISAICERDLDLLLLEELACSRSFLRWLCKKVNTRPQKLLSLTRSLVDENGESDLVLRFIANSGEAIALLIENKLSASFQKGQKRRYQVRKRMMLRRKEVARCYLCLVAPRAYLGQGLTYPEFDVVLTYEEVLNWFGDSTLDPARRSYKCTVIEKAIERAARGWQPYEDAEVTAVWHQYWKLACKIAPLLQMPEPLARASTSSFVQFLPLGFPPGLRIVHKLRHGYVDLQFGRCAQCIGKLRQRLGRRLPAGMVLTTANASAVIRIEVPRISLSGDPKAQVSQMKVGLTSSMRLFRWFRRNAHLVSRVLGDAQGKRNISPVP